MQIAAAQSGFWSAYYQNSKNAKPIAKIIKMLEKSKWHIKTEPVETTQEDVNSFEAKDEKFAQFLKENGVV